MRLQFYFIVFIYPKCIYNLVILVEEFNLLNLNLQIEK